MTFRPLFAPLLGLALLFGTANAATPTDFTATYKVLRGDDLIMECEEVRIFAARRTDGKNGIRAVAIPKEIRALCE